MVPQHAFVDSSLRPEDYELAERQVAIISMDARHVNAALKMRPVKTDRNDAAGLAQIVQVIRRAEFARGITQTSKSSERG
jgi:hypothetical protein